MNERSTTCGLKDHIETYLQILWLQFEDISLQKVLPKFTVRYLNKKGYFKVNNQQVHHVNQVATFIRNFEQTLPKREL